MHYINSIDLPLMAQSGHSKDLLLALGNSGRIPAAWLINPSRRWVLNLDESDSTREARRGCPRPGGRLLPDLAEAGNTGASWQCVR
jgi:hypothetical protein